MYLQEEVNDYLGGPVELDKEIQGESHVELYHLERIPMAQLHSHIIGLS